MRGLTTKELEFRTFKTKTLLSHFRLMLHFLIPEKVRKSLVFWSFHVLKWNIGLIWVKGKQRCNFDPSQFCMGLISFSYCFQCTWELKARSSDVSIEISSTSYTLLGRPTYTLKRLWVRSSMVMTALQSLGTHYTSYIITLPAPCISESCIKIRPSWNLSRHHKKVWNKHLS